MDLFRAAVLGIVQGLSEFLPISSSGHLILVRRLFEWEDQGLSFDVGLHVGTLLALLIYFWRDWWTMITVGLADLRDHQFRFREHRDPSRLIWLIALGSVPAAVAGLLLDSWIEDNLRQPWLIAILLSIFAAILLAADRYGAKKRETGSLRPLDAVLIGVAQAIAIFPGVSRSGVTMSAGLFRDLKREDAARFAFLLGTPAFIGAAILKSKDLAGESSKQSGELLVGFIFSFVVGFLVIHFLMRYLRTQSLVPFAVYRWGVAIITLIIAWIRIS